MESLRVNSIISGRSPPLYCILTLITMYGHQNKSRLVTYSIFGLPDYGTVTFYREIQLKWGLVLFIVVITVKYTCNS